LLGNGSQQEDVLIENQVTHKPQEFRWIADLGIGVNFKKITLL